MSSPHQIENPTQVDIAQTRLEFAHSPKINFNPEFLTTPNSPKNASNWKFFYNNEKDDFRHKVKKALVLENEQVIN